MPLSGLVFTAEEKRLKTISQTSPKGPMWSRVKLFAGEQKYTAGGKSTPRFTPIPPLFVINSLRAMSQFVGDIERHK